MESSLSLFRMHWDHEPGQACYRYGVPPSGGPDRLKPGLQTGGSWRAPTPFGRALDHEPTLPPPRRGTEQDAGECLLPSREGRGWVGCWKGVLIPAKELVSNQSSPGLLIPVGLERQ